MVKHIQLLKSKFWIIKQMSIHTNENHSNIMFQTNRHINIQLDQKKNMLQFMFLKIKLVSN